jgi:23S rRNA (guanine2535-N1)-methyltransferase
MQYKFVKHSQDYSDLASGRVFYSLPGHPAFPVRLASEIFQRCLAAREAIYQETSPCTLYDPCCGAAYHLSVVAYLQREHIRMVIASDIDEKAVALAKQNLGLLNLTGLDQRIAEISAMFEEYQKDSHKSALESAYRIRDAISTVNRPLATDAFQANATDRQALLNNIQPGSVDIVFSDVPYGLHSQWQGADESSNPMASMLEAILDLLSPASIVAIVSDKQQKAVHEKYRRLEQFRVGKRRVVLLRPA